MKLYEINLIDVYIIKVQGSPNQTNQINKKNIYFENQLKIHFFFN